MKRVLPGLYFFQHEDLVLLKEVEKRLRTMYSLLDEVDKATLCHNDFGSRNILVNERGGNKDIKRNHGQVNE